MDGRKIVTEKLTGRRPNELIEQSNAIPAALMQDENQVTVRFQTHPGNFAGGVFGLRLLTR